ncbi:ribosomal subunit interface protein [Candidatus Saccharibacteria bacterium RIFCSPHIGHO2_12_FULL_41_12]|nr:MAG: ribosomal subunit interface protein [Candidatus Saccharibacteria bacterium RIFCSPHIGHO2_12_FULL_41_12]
MIKSIQLSGVHSKLTDEVRAYVQKKIGGLDTYIPKDARKSVQVDIKIKEKKAKDMQTFECEVIMKLPKSTLTVHERSSSALSAIDIAEENLKNQLKKYKDKHSGPRLHRRILRRINRQF